MNKALTKDLVKALANITGNKNILESMLHWLYNDASKEEMLKYIND